MVRPRVLGLALALLTLLLYLPVSRHDFINYDDPDYITENRHVLSGMTASGVRWAFTSFHASNWHPVTWLSHMLDVELFGLDPGAHHMVSALLHALNALLLFIFLYDVTNKKWSSILVAALFALHPLRVQSVAWAAERKDVLCAAFAFIGLIAYCRYSRYTPVFPTSAATNRQSATYFYAFALAAFILGLMSKPMLVTLPILLLLLDFWPLQRLKDRDIPGRLFRLVLEKWPFFIGAFGVSVATWMAQRTEAVISLERLPMPNRIANALLSYSQYIIKTLWPSKLAVLYPLPSSINWLAVAVSAFLVAGVTILVWRFRKSRPHLLTGWFWFFITLLPVIGIVQVGGQFMADRYTYIPLIGLVWAIVWEADIWARRLGFAFWTKFSVCSALLILLAALTVREQQFWHNSITLFRRAVAVTTNNAVAHSNLGLAYETAGDLPAAMREYKAAVQINPKLAQARNNLAGLLSESGKPEEALPHLTEAIALKPNWWQAHINLATALVRLERTNEAVAHYENAVRLAPNDPRPHYATARALLRLGQTHAAIRHFKEALKVDSNHLPTLVYLARLLASSPDEHVRDGNMAQTLAEKAVNLTAGTDAFVLDTLAIAYAEQNRFPEALSVLRKAIEIEGQRNETNSLTPLKERTILFERSVPYRESFTSTNSLAAPR